MYSPGGIAEARKNEPEKKVNKKGVRDLVNSNPRENKSYIHDLPLPDSCVYTCTFTAPNIMK